MNEMVEVFVVGIIGILVLALVILPGIWLMEAIKNTVLLETVIYTLMILASAFLVGALITHTDTYRRFKRVR